MTGPGQDEQGSYEPEQATDILADVRRYTAMQRGEGDSIGVVVSFGTLKRVIAEIERLRSIAGKAAVGPSFAEITKDLPRRSGESD